MLQAWLIKPAGSKSKLLTNKSSSSNVDSAMTKKRALDDETVADSEHSQCKKKPSILHDPVYDQSIPTDGPEYLSNERDSMHRSWYWRLEPEFNKSYFKKLKEFLGAEEANPNVRIFPDQSCIYTWARIPFNSIKVVILGQDPYHGPGQAHGLCFSVLPGTRIPPSLANIYTELSSDLAMPKPDHGYLNGWTTQGVLLLNTVLTVRQGEPNSHKNKGWETLTDAIIRTLNTHLNGLVFILWGNHAQKKGAGINSTKHLILKAPHPSPLSVHRGGFFGSKPFSKTNTYLKSLGKEPIDWQYLPSTLSGMASEPTTPL